MFSVGNNAGAPFKDRGKLRRSFFASDGTAQKATPERPRR
jgi:hypothetical protein